MSERRRFYQNNGYMIVRNLIPTRQLDRVFADIERVFSQQASRLGADQAINADRDSFSRVATALFKADQAVYLAAAKLAQYTVSVHRLSLCDEILAVLDDLGLAFPALSTRQVLHFMADSLRIPGGYHKTPPHQDWRSIQGSLDGVIVWVPFCDVGKDNYPLEIIPGSHRLGLLPSAEDPFGHRVADGVIDEAAFSPLEVSKGDAVFFSTFLVHRTGDKGGKNVRVAASFRFNNAAEPSFIARNYPNPYIYRPDMRLLIEGFPTKSDIATVFPPTAVNPD